MFGQVKQDDLYTKQDTFHLAKLGVIILGVWISKGSDK